MTTIAKHLGVGKQKWIVQKAWFLLLLRANYLVNGWRARIKKT